MTLTLCSPSFILMSSPQELQEKLNSSLSSDILYNTFETTLVYGVPLWVEAAHLYKKENPSKVLMQNISPLFALNIGIFPGYLFAGVELGLSFFVCQKELLYKERLTEFVKEKGGNLWTVPITKN